MGRQDKKENNVIKDFSSLTSILNKKNESNIIDSNYKENINKENTESKIDIEQIKKISDYKRKSKAPYNFVPLSNCLVESQEIPDFDIYHKNMNTGYLEIEIETITPLYIRDSLTKYEMVEKEKLEKNNKDQKFINSDFYSPTSKVSIPGSSLRGMTRTLVEILSNGKFNFYDNKRFYFRGLADESNLSDDYMKIVSGEKKTNDKKSDKYKTLTGIIYKSGKFEYSIRPSIREKITENQTKDLLKSKNIEFEYFSYTKIDNDFLVISGKKISREMIKGKEQEINYWKVKISRDNSKSFIINENDIENYKNDTARGKDVPNLIDILDKKVSKIPDDLIENDKIEIPCFYFEWEDNKGNKRVSFGHTPLFRLAYNKDIKDHIPEYLRVDSKKEFNFFRMSKKALEKIEKTLIEYNIYDTNKTYIKKLEVDFGFSKFYNSKEVRKIIKKIFSNQYKEEVYTKILSSMKIFDISEAIFGNETDFSSRVFFEDAIINKNQEDYFMEIGIPKILSNPKATTFQNYLVQKDMDKKKLEHYNNETSIRGYKFYWHKSGNYWSETELSFDKKNFNLFLNEKNLNLKQFEKFIIKNDKDKININIDISKIDTHLKKLLLDSIGLYEKQHTKIKPIKPKVKFKSIIRFENLSDVELGALLFALDLPNECYHKIGMGKPLGLGSVKIRPKLYLSDRQKRYKSFFEELNNPLLESKKIIDFKNTFEKYIISITHYISIWNSERIKEFYHLLNFEKGKKLESEGKTRYMEMKSENDNEFKQRPVLPLPSDMLSDML